MVTLAHLDLFVVPTLHKPGLVVMAGVQLSRFVPPKATVRFLTPSICVPIGPGRS